MATTVEQALDKAPPHAMPDLFRKVSIGSVLAGMRARNTNRTGLASNTTQVHPYAAAILSVDDGADTPLGILATGTPGVGEVLVTYDSAGVPTLTFSGAVTAYSVTECCLIGDMVADLALDADVAV